MEFPELDVLTRSVVRERGLSSAQIARRLDGSWERVHRAIYLENAEDFTDDERWRRRLRAHLTRGGPLAAIGHRAAARVHGLDGSWGDHLDIVVPFESTFRVRPAIRSRTLDQELDIVTVDGDRVTTLARTLSDVGRFVSLDELELAVESALRLDPRTPHEWRTDLLAELHERAGGHLRRPGTGSLRRVLARRPLNARPTGSAAETRFAQALRVARSPALDRQPAVHVLDSRGRPATTYFPDFADIRKMVLVEIDGADAHATAEALRRDLSRQNVLTNAFTMRRYTGSQVRSDPAGVARDVANTLEHAVRRDGDSWSSSGCLIRLRPDGCDLVVP